MYSLPRAGLESPSTGAWCSLFQPRYEWGRLQGPRSGGAPPPPNPCGRHRQCTATSREASHGGLSQELTASGSCALGICPTQARQPGPWLRTWWNQGSLLLASTSLNSRQAWSLWSGWEFLGATMLPGPLLPHPASSLPRFSRGHICPQLEDLTCLSLLPPLPWTFPRAPAPQITQPTHLGPAHDYDMSKKSSYYVEALAYGSVCDGR